MTKELTLHYAMARLMDDGFVTNEKNNVVKVQEKLNQLYEQLHAKGAFITSTKLADMVVQQDATSNCNKSNKKSKRGIK